MNEPDFGKGSVTYLGVEGIMVKCSFATLK